MRKKKMKSEEDEGDGGTFEKTTASLIASFFGVFVVNPPLLGR